MTLVAGLSVGGLPAFIGDLLLSRRLPAPVDLPTRSKPGLRPGLDRHFAAELAQKLVIVRPWFLIAWAGSQSNANRIIQGLDALLPERSEDLARVEPALELLDSCSEDGELVVLIIRGNAIHPIGVRTRGFELDGKRVYLMGSGKSEFFDYLQAHPEVLPGQETRGGLLARAIALRFCARAMAIQWITGAGLEESWGGGFEVVYPARNGTFRKCDKLLFRAWKIEADGEYHSSGRSFFARYHGRSLYLSCIDPEEKTYPVHSPIGEPVAPPSFERCAPTWTIDLFLHTQTASIIEFARFVPDGRPIADHVELTDGRLSAWAMDQAYVDGLVRVAIAEAGQGNTFNAFRW
jgi:hypothetical protein